MKKLNEEMRCLMEKLVSSYICNECGSQLKLDADDNVCCTKSNMVKMRLDKSKSEGWAEMTNLGFPEGANLSDEEKEQLKTLINKPHTRIVLTPYKPHTRIVLTPCCKRKVKLELEEGQVELFNKCKCGKKYFFTFKKWENGKAGKVRGRGVLSDE